jgi:predicted nucleic acid-binding Zn ribbon protein
MPVYEYYCRPCDRTYTVVMSQTEHETKQSMRPNRWSVHTVMERRSNKGFFAYPPTRYIPEIRP